MTHTFLKFAAYGFAWIAPIVILLTMSRWMYSRSITTAKRRTVLAILIPFLWCAGLVSSLIGQAFHEAAWHTANPMGIVTEDDMLALGDSPNVFVGWILLGWLPIVVGLLLSNSLIQNKKEAQQAAT